MSKIGIEGDAETEIEDSSSSLLTLILMMVDINTAAFGAMRSVFLHAFEIRKAFGAMRSVFMHAFEIRKVSPVYNLHGRGGGREAQNVIIQSTIRQRIRDNKTLLHSVQGVSHQHHQARVPRKCRHYSVSGCIDLM